MSGNTVIIGAAGPGDAVPGINVTYRVTPNREGHYPIVCAELCGLGHATMRATAVVESEAKFDEFLQTAANPPTPTPGIRRVREDYEYSETG